MNFEDLDFVKLEQEIYRLDGEIRKLKPLQERKEQLSSFLGVLQMYLIERNTALSKLATPQSKHAYAWMSNYPLLALYFGSMGFERLSKRLYSYSGDEKGEKIYSDQDMKGLSVDWIKRVEALLRPFLKDKEASPRKAPPVSAKRSVGAEVTEV